jgi:sugar fermentation stimulation protein A
MQYPTPLLKGVFLRRYKRFFADIRLDSGQEITAHTPNTGSLRTCTDEGAEAYVSQSDNPKRSLQYTWELVRSGTSLVGVNTLLANRLAEEAIRAGRIPELSGYATVRREVRYGENSRVDLLLEDSTEDLTEDSPYLPPCYVEVKNVSMGIGGVAAFPDAVSARAKKHMGELAAQVAQGARAAVLFVVQRMDCERFTPADEIDPAYGEALRAAVKAGVTALAWRADVSPDGIELTAPLPVDL